MKYAFNTWAYSSFPVWVPSYTLDDTIRRIAAAGYDGIEIGCAAPHAWPDHLNGSRRKELRSLLENEKLTPVSLLPAPGGGPGNNPASPLPTERRATTDHYKAVVDLAADLGAGLVLYIGGWQVHGTNRKDALAWSLECLVEVADHARARQIVLAVEPTPADSNLIESADDAIELMRRANKPNVKVMFDTFHALYRNEVSSDYVRSMGDSLVHVHAADTDRLPPGEGKVDFLSVLRALQDVDYQGYITMEIGFSRRDVDPDAYARLALQNLKSLESLL
jgi:protein FrlC